MANTATEFGADKRALPISRAIPHGVFSAPRDSVELVLHSRYDSRDEAIDAADELNSPHRSGTDWCMNPAAPIYLVRQL